MSFATSLTAIAMALAAVMFGLWALPRGVGRRVRVGVAGAWAAAAVILFLVPVPGLVLLAAFALLATLAPWSPAQRVAFYFAVVPFLPRYLSADLPLPGVNYLASVTVLKLCAVTLLLPLLARPAPRDGGNVSPWMGMVRMALVAADSCLPSPDRRSAHTAVGYGLAAAGLAAAAVVGLNVAFGIALASLVAVLALALLGVLVLLSVPFLVFGPVRAASRSGLPRAGVFVVAYTAYTALAYLQANELTPSLRFLADQILLLVVPYFAITRALRSEADLGAALNGFFYASSILAGVAFVSTVKRWNFYTLWAPASIDIIPDFRWGLLRVLATTNTHSLGFHLAAGVLVLLALRATGAFGRARFPAVMTALLAGLFCTGSRGSMLALAVGFATYVAALSSGARARWIVLAGVASIGIYGLLYVLSPEAAASDQFGTFDYRQKLLEAALRKIERDPWFGDIAFLKSHVFDGLVQGQGIVDVTNLYLQVVLEYGLCGLALFLSIFLSPALGLARRLWLRNPRSRVAGPGLPYQSALLAALVAWLVLIATTSDFGLTIYFGVSLAALAQAALRVSAPRPVRRVATHMLRAPAPSRPAAAAV